MSMLRIGIVVLACGAVLRHLQKRSITFAKRKANRGHSISSPDETGAQTFLIDSSKRIQLYCRRWGSFDNPLSSVIFVHSELLSGSVFKYLAEKLNERRFMCYSVDLTGFGKSGRQQGEESHIESYADYLEDIHDVVEVVKNEQGDGPIVLYGEGLGAACCLAYALREDRKHNAKAIIANAPMLQPPISPATVDKGCYAILSKLFSTVQGPREELRYDIPDLFLDPEVGVIARDNFEKNQPATVRKIKELGSLCAFVNQNIDQLRTSLMVMHAEGDVRSEIELSTQLKEKAASESKYLRVYKDTKHGILYDSDETRDSAIKDIIGFIGRNAQQLSPQPQQ